MTLEEAVVAGAGAGIGGNGGSGGQANFTIERNSYHNTLNSCGSDGEKGEDCGVIKLHNDITVFAYGGAGGGSGLNKAVSSGSGRGRLSGGSVLVGRSELVVAGGDHWNGGGGFTGGDGEMKPKRNDNGEGGAGTNGKGGAGYYDYGKYIEDYDAGEVRLWTRNFSGVEETFCYVGGEGGCVAGWSAHSIDYAGDGGVAGKGGIVVVSSDCVIHAYNGNKYTDGTNYNDGANQLEIYAQSGVLRKVYKGNYHWGETEMRTFSYWSNILGDQLLLETDLVPATSNDTLHNVLIRDEINIDPLSYEKDGENIFVGQGIGSGAGYVEVSNGTYTVDSRLD